MTAPRTDADTGQKLVERVKELTALHRTARILQDYDRTDDALVNEIVKLLPAAWQYPDVAAARVVFRGAEHTTPGFRHTPWTQAAAFGSASDPAASGEVVIAYLEARPDADEGPFLAEERELIDSLADMLGAHLERRRSEEALLAAQESLAAQVERRTAELRRLAAELTLAEARQRRLIAADLHDHVGQALAYIRHRLRVLRGNSIFSGQESEFDDVQGLLDMTIRYIRDLTGQISPPVLYELGLEPALDWLAEHMEAKQGFDVHLTSTGVARGLSEAHQVMLYQSVRELLANSARHSGANECRLALEWSEDRIRVTVVDTGRGFALERAGAPDPDAGFGLFSLRERIGEMGGTMLLRTAPGDGCAVVLEVPVAGAPSS